MNTEIARKVIESRGLVVSSAENGEIGVRKFSDSAVGYYDVILMYCNPVRRRHYPVRNHQADSFDVPDTGLLCPGLWHPHHAGTRWEVVIPVTKLQNGLEEKPKAESPEVLKGRRILLCEDNQMNTEIASMLAFLRDANTSQSVIDIFDGLYSLIGADAFTELFPLILTDNGSEFSNPKRIEFGPSGKGHLRTRVFYCDAGSPFQKGAIEVNHVGVF